MIFITFGKWKAKLTKETADEATRRLGQMTKEGIKWIGNYWTLGRYDLVAIAEASDEKTMMKALIQWSDLLSSETIVAVPREEAIKLLE